MANLENEEFVEEEVIPTQITEEYLKIIFENTEEFIRNLRSERKYDAARDVSRLVTILENLNFQLRGEEQKSSKLLEQFVDASNRIEEATKISQSDHDVIQQLRSEIINAWSHSDAQTIREQHTYESLDVMREKFADLSQKLERYASMKYEDADDFGKQKTTILKEIQRMFMENEEMHRKFLVQRAYSEQLQNQVEYEKEKNREIYREWDLASNDTLANRRRVQILTKKVEDMTDNEEKLIDSLTHYKEKAGERYKRIKDYEKQIEELNEELNNIKSDNSNINTAKSKLEAVLKSYLKELNENRHEIKQFQNYSRLKDDENRKLIIEKEQEVKRNIQIAKKLASAESIASKLEHELLIIKNQALTAEKERDTLNKAYSNLIKENEKLQKKSDAFIKEKERLNGIILNLKHDNESIKKEFSDINDQLKISIEHEKVSSMNVKKLKYNLETIESEKAFLTLNAEHLIEEIKKNKNLLDKYEIELKTLKEQIVKVKDNYITAVRNMKKAESKFQRCREKEYDVSYRMNVYKNQIRSNDYRLAAKINDIKKLKKRINKLEKTIYDIHSVHSKTKDELRSCRIEVTNLKVEKNNLKNDLHNFDEKFTKLKTYTDTVIRERDMIANIMYRQADEKGIKETEVEALKLTIKRGEATYNERLEDIKVLKNEIKNLRSQCNVLKRGLENTADMRHEVFQLHRKLHQEKVKVKVLREEMNTPMNIHRWRKLKSFDPTRMELINKCQKLQRKSIKQFNQITKADEIIKSLHEKISQQQKEIQKHSNIDLQKKLMFTRAQMLKNEKRMKASIAISRATENDVSLKDYSINQLERDLNEFKSQLFKEKREKEKLTEKYLHLRKSLENNRSK
ncbi:hypothetical protein PVAND_001804 [Polypedilum vanderplanki]|uniref:Uncharacterized protein n=1 Tax=Polypedilum vanderplanki TaxID=319348 RepID=A0A9J6BQB5_POLVA|nr:hypothetical protein PVAND_001804 [Polypedilum vanderplanki]